MEMALDSALSFLLTTQPFVFPRTPLPPFLFRFPLDFFLRNFLHQLGYLSRPPPCISRTARSPMDGNESYEIQRRRPLATPAKSARGPGKAEKFHSRKLLPRFRCPAPLAILSGARPYSHGRAHFHACVSVR